MSVNFNHLRSFYAVAGDRSVTRAARRLNISQPALSKQLKALEDRYKVELIEGTRPPLTLTSAGEALFERAKVLFAVTEEIDAVLGEDDLESGAILRLGTWPRSLRTLMRSSLQDGKHSLSMALQRCLSKRSRAAQACRE